MTPIDKTEIWQKLIKHKQKISKTHMRELFAKNPKRFDKFSLEASEIFMDFSKQKIIAETIQLLLDLLSQTNFVALKQKMFAGEIINNTEQRKVLHTALRSNKNKEVKNTLAKMGDCVTKLHNKKWLGFNGKAITDVVNIGIGGSNLGPLMATTALNYYKNNINCHFVSNIDGAVINEIITTLNPETTLFIVASKTFTTQETLTNATTAKKWLEQYTNKANEQHFIAATANPKKAREFGIQEKNIFPFWDWVGGRYSLWSAIGLPIAIATSMEYFKDLLAGACRMDEHFKNAPIEKNMPAIMALLGIWNINFLGFNTLAILPYDHSLRFFPAYLQQLEMESNGKRVTREGSAISYPTAPIVWGAEETNGQHAFHQLLMQGIQKTAIDFILPLKSHHQLQQHHLLLGANCLAQSQALMLGKTTEEVITELLEQGLTKAEAEQLAPHKVISGDTPSTTLLINKLTPSTLGALIALYEHKVFTQGAIWEINSFDQWGVELGKKIANKIIANLKQQKQTQFDSSTMGLLRKLKQSEN